MPFPFRISTSLPSQAAQQEAEHSAPAGQCALWPWER